VHIYNLLFLGKKKKKEKKPGNSSLAPVKQFSQESLFDINIKLKRARKLSG
jgi:hypothetical protein